MGYTSEKTFNFDDQRPDWDADSLLIDWIFRDLWQIDQYNYFFNENELVSTWIERDMRNIQKW